MAVCRILWAMLIAMAVAVAPVGAALASSHSSTKAAMHDCHGKAPAHCADCDGMAKKAKCPGDGSKCCKLVGAVNASPKVMRFAAAVEVPIEPQEPAGCCLQPQPRPPRS